MGIDADELPRIFERFFRGSRMHEARSTGSGLGLAIVKSIVDMHGGTIAVESQVGKGSTFVVTLPRDPREAIEAVPSPTAAATPGATAEASSTPDAVGRRRARRPRRAPLRKPDAVPPARSPWSRPGDEAPIPKMVDSSPGDAPRLQPLTGTVEHASRGRPSGPMPSPPAGDPDLDHDRSALPAGKPGDRPDPSLDDTQPVEIRRYEPDPGAPRRLDQRLDLAHPIRRAPRTRPLVRAAPAAASTPVSPVEPRGSRRGVGFGPVVAGSVLSAVLASGGTIAILDRDGRARTAAVQSILPAGTQTSSSQPGQPVTIDESSAIIDASARVSPAVVRIRPSRAPATSTARPSPAPASAPASSTRPTAGSSPTSTSSRAATG